MLRASRWAWRLAASLPAWIAVSLLVGFGLFVSSRRAPFNRELAMWFGVALLVWWLVEHHTARLHGFGVRLSRDPRFELSFPLARQAMRTRHGGRMHAGMGPRHSTGRPRHD